MHHPFVLVVALVWGVSSASLVLVTLYEWWQHAQKQRAERKHTGGGGVLNRQVAIKIANREQPEAGIDDAAA